MLTRRAAIASLAAPLLAQSKLTRILCGGDVMLARGVARRAREHKDPAWPMRELVPVLSAADIAFVNLEAPFSDRGPTPKVNMIFKGEPDMVESLTLAGIDIVSTANNHVRDRGSHGLEFTLDHLAAHNIAAVGTAKSADIAHAGVVLERNNTRFGFLAYTYDANNGNYRDIDPRICVMDENALRTDITSLKSRADVVLISMHAGWEYQRKPNTQQKRFAHAAIDAGARAVIGHHPHVRQPMEQYNGGVIFYSLGNLVFDQGSPAETQWGSLAELTFQGTSLVETRLRTVRIQGTVPRLHDETTATPPR